MITRSCGMNTFFRGGYNIGARHDVRNVWICGGEHSGGESGWTILESCHKHHTTSREMEPTGNKKASMTQK